MDNSEGIRQERIRQALDRMAASTTINPALRLLLATVFGLAFASLCRTQPISVAGHSLSPKVLGAACLAIWVAVALLLLHRRHSRSASGAIGTPERTRTCWATIRSQLFFPTAFLIAFIFQPLEFLNSTLTWLFTALLIAVLVYLLKADYFNQDLMGPLDPPRHSVDPRLADPDAAALVAILDWDADLRADTAASALNTSITKLWEVLRPLHEHGIARAWKRNRTVITELGDAPVNAKEVWLGLTGTGRALLD